MVCEGGGVRRVGQVVLSIEKGSGEYGMAMGVPSCGAGKSETIVVATDNFNFQVARSRRRSKTLAI